jgi:hypothetical protein
MGTGNSSNKPVSRPISPRINVERFLASLESSNQTSNLSASTSVVQRPTAPRRPAAVVAQVIVVFESHFMLSKKKFSDKKVHKFFF